MAEELAISGDKGCPAGTYNGETDGQILCKHVENSVDVCEDELPPEPNGNCFEITCQNSTDHDDDDDSSASMEMRSLRSSLKRRPHVVSKPLLVKYRSNKECCNDSEHLIADNDSELANNSSENYLSPTCLRSKQGRTSRDTRNSAGASGGIFSEDFPADFSEFQGETDENLHGTCFYFSLYCSYRLLSLYEAISNLISSGGRKMPWNTILFARGCVVCPIMLR